MVNMKEKHILLESILFKIKYGMVVHNRTISHCGKTECRHFFLRRSIVSAESQYVRYPRKAGYG